MSRISITTFKHFDRKVYLLLGSMYLNRLGFFIAFPYLAFYLTYLHFTPTMIGVIVASQAMSYSLSSVICGYISDRFGKKPAMVLAMLISSFASLCLAHINAPMGYIFFNALIGISRSMFDAAMPAYLTEITAKKDHPFIFNLRFLIINAAGAMGPLIGVYFASQHSNAVFNISAIVCLINAILIQLQLPKSKVIEAKPSLQKITFISTCHILIKDKALLFIVMATILYSFIYIQLEAPFAQVLQLRNPEYATWLFGLMWIINTVMIVLFQLPLTKITKNISLITLIGISGILFIIAFIGLALYVSISAFVFCIILITLAEMLFAPIANIVIADIAPPDLRSTYFGALSLSSLGLAIGPIIGGLIIQYSTSEMLFLIMALLSGGIIIFFRHGLKAASSRTEKIKKPEYTNTLN